MVVWFEWSLSHLIMIQIWTLTDKILPRKESVLREARHPELEVDEEDLCLLGSFIPVTRVSMAGR